VSFALFREVAFKKIKKNVLRPSNYGVGPGGGWGDYLLIILVKVLMSQLKLSKSHVSNDLL
jgi:hypothetical protein